MEILYLSEKHRIPIDLGETLARTQASECYAVVDLNAEILKVAETIEFRELHDRLILATAKLVPGRGSLERPGVPAGRRHRGRLGLTGRHWSMPRRGIGM